MERYHSPKLMREASRALKLQGKRIGFLATMGALHEGHLTLARKLADSCDIRVVSIFVNPTQFNDKKDYDAYTVDLDRDLKLLEKEGVDLVFTPNANEMYPEGAESRVELAEISKPLEGVFRPGHFSGVATVVAALFNIIEPDLAIFGEKDFQQLRLIERMVEDLHFGLKVLRGKTVRENDGLALSSRNVRLSAQERIHALNISKGLFSIQHAFREGEKDSQKLKALLLDALQKIPGAKIEYAEIVDEQHLHPVQVVSASSRALVAVQVGNVRLIDNMRIA